MSRERYTNMCLFKEQWLITQQENARRGVGQLITNQHSTAHVITSLVAWRLSHLSILSIL